MSPRKNCLHDVCIVGKTKIRDGGIQFEVPQDRELPQRFDAVLEAIYAAFGIG
jgi:RNA polymerase sigma-70 factor (ECF subfamily)